MSLLAVGTAFVFVQSAVLSSMCTVIPVLFELSLNKHVYVHMFQRGNSCGLHSDNVFKLAAVGSIVHALTILGILYF